MFSIFAFEERFSLIKVDSNGNSKTLEIRVYRALVSFSSALLHCESKDKPL